MPPEDLAQALLSCPSVEGMGTEAMGGGLVEKQPPGCQGSEEQDLGSHGAAQQRKAGAWLGASRREALQTEVIN